AVAYTLDRGFANDRERHERLKGVILLDALFGETKKFQKWWESSRGKSFFVNLHTPSSRPDSLLMETFAGVGEQTWQGVKKIKPGQFLSLTVDTPHMQLPVAGPPQWPLATFLQKLHLPTR
ncbi:MAG: hypothetical protein HQM02_05385, partial [Magnetococcales bacterium]|nr:hypothetical protein [Magnetococcales bacterium]